MTAAYAHRVSVAAFPARRLLDTAALPWLVLGALAALQAGLILTHVAWRDELQALMIAVHSPSLGALLANLRFEAHPPLWYFLLRGVATMVPAAPPLLVGVQLLLAAATMAIVWTRAPFPPWFRLLILASAPFLFDWGTIARSYGLGAILYVGALALNRRPVWPFLLLGLVASTALHFLMLAGVTALLLLARDRRSAVPGFALFSALALAALWAAWPSPDAHSAITAPQAWPMRLLAGFQSVSRAILPFDPTETPIRWDDVNALFGFVLGLALPALGVIALCRDRVAAGLFLLLFAAVWSVSAFAYPAYARHTSVLFLFVIGAEWIRLSRCGDAVSAGSVVWTSTLAACGLWMAGWAIVLPFTPMRDIMHASAAADLHDGEWASYPGFLGVELSARLQRPVYDPQQQCRAWFQTWNAASVKAVDPATLDARLAGAAAAAGGRMALLARADLSGLPHARLVADFPMGLNPEPMRLYEVTAVPGGSPVPLCPPR